MIFPLGGYAGNNNSELGAAVAGILTGTFAVACWWGCAYLGYWIGLMAGYPTVGTLTGGFGLPILAVLINGRIAKGKEIQ